jgi:hypothetical protein
MNPITITEEQLAQVIRSTPLGHGHSGAPDEPEIPGLAEQLAHVLFGMLAELPRPEPGGLPDLSGLSESERRNIRGGPLTDAPALNEIQEMLRDPEWSVGMLEDIRELVNRTGRSCENYPDDRQTWGRH